MPSKNYKNQKSKQEKIAKERIRFLFQQARLSFKTKPALSDKYIKQARRIAMKYRIKLLSSQKKKFCKHCYKYLVPGQNCRVRIHKSRVIYYCSACKKYMRHPVK